MSRNDPTDLVCRARRGELSGEERWRLDELLMSSPETRLVSTMLSEFDRESRVRPGDDVLLARIGARVAGLNSEPPVRLRRRKRLPFLLAAAILLIGGVSWAVRMTVTRAPAPEKQLLPFAPTQRPVNKSAPRRAPAPPVEPKKDDAAPEQLDTAPTSEATPAPAPSASQHHAAGARASRNAPAEPPQSAAAELFARANLLRRQGRSVEAASLYRLIVDNHGGTREAPLARLALAKLLRVKDPARALAQFRALAESGGALRPEALWGVAESARSLGNRAAEAQALSDLLREYPDSPYADAARSRAVDGTR